jgi:nucleotide-binding universal stress UspA family protein
MYNRILVTVNDSEFSEHTFNRALTLAGQSQARLLLLQVLTADLTLHECETNIGAGEQSEACLVKLRSQGDKVRASGAIADLRMLSGDVGQQICETAEKWGADLILMGHQHFLTSVHQSVGNYVIDHAPCAVLVLPNENGATETRDAQSNLAQRVQSNTSQNNPTHRQELAQVN